MAEAKEIPPGEYDLHLGSTFEHGKSHDKPVYHTLRCWFFWISL